MSYQNDVYELYDWDGQNVVYVPKDGIRGAAYMNEYGNGYHPSIPLSNTSFSNSNNIMPIPLIAAGIGALGGILGGVISQSSQEKSNTKMMSLQARIQKEQFDYTNAYNTPAQQVNRLIEAGLNPNLLYGSSHPTGTASMPQVSAQRGVPLDLDLQSALRYSLDAMRLEKENRLVDQQIENMHQQNRALEIQNDISEQTKPWTIEQKMYELQDVMNRVEAGEINNVLLSNKRVRDDFATEIYGKLVDEGLADDIERSKYYMDMQSYYIALNQQEYLEKQIDKLTVDIANSAKQGRILDYQAKLADMGINPNDPVWMRAVALIVDKLLNYFNIDAGDVIRAGAKKAGLN